MGKSRKIALVQATQSLLPAIVVVQTSDNGQTLITPVPLENPKLSIKIIRHWVTFALWLLITRCWQIHQLTLASSLSRPGSTGNSR